MFIAAVRSSYERMSCEQEFHFHQNGFYSFNCLASVIKRNLNESAHCMENGNAERVGKILNFKFKIFCMEDHSRSIILFSLWNDWCLQWYLKVLSLIMTRKLESNLRMENIKTWMEKHLENQKPSRMQHCTEGKYDIGMFLMETMCLEKRKTIRGTVKILPFAHVSASKMKYVAEGHQCCYRTPQETLPKFGKLFHIAHNTGRSTPPQISPWKLYTPNLYDNRKRTVIMPFI